MLTASGAFAAVCVLALTAAPAAQARGGKERLDRVERKIVRLVNSQRARRGLARLRTTRALNLAADYHSWEMVAGNYFAHASRNGTSSSRRIRRYKNARRVGECLAFASGGNLARRVVRMWMRSPGHRRVLLSGSYRRIGVARRGGFHGGSVVTLDVSSRR